MLIQVPPIQAQFDEDDVRTMNVGRRQLRTEWKNALHEPGDPDKNWTIVLPFPNTYQNAFFTMCDANAYAQKSANGRLCLFLNDTTGRFRQLDWTVHRLLPADDFYLEGAKEGELPLPLHSIPKNRTKICQPCPRPKMSTMSPAGQYAAAARLYLDDICSTVLVRIQFSRTL